MATHSSILALKIPWAEEPGSPQGRKVSDMTEWLHFHFHIIIWSQTWIVSQDNSSSYLLLPEIKTYR